MDLAPYEERLSLMRSLMWDYNIPPEECLDVVQSLRFKSLSKRYEFIRKELQ